MSYNPGGWNDDKLKVYGILVLVAAVLYAVGVGLGWIDPQ